MELPLLAGRAERMRSRLKIRFVSSRIRVAMAPKHSFVSSHWQATPSSSQSLRGPFLDHFEDHPNLAQITTGRGFFGHSKHSLMTRGESTVTPSVNMRQSLPHPGLAVELRAIPCHGGGGSPTLAGVMAWFVGQACIHGHNYDDQLDHDSR